MINRHSANIPVLRSTPRRCRHALCRHWPPGAPPSPSLPPVQADAAASTLSTDGLSFPVRADSKLRFLARGQHHVLVMVTYTCTSIYLSRPDYVYDMRYVSTHVQICSICHRIWGGQTARTWVETSGPTSCIKTRWEMTCPVVAPAQPTTT